MPRWGLGHGIHTMHVLDVHTLTYVSVKPHFGNHEGHPATALCHHSQFGTNAGCFNSPKTDVAAVQKQMLLLQSKTDVAAVQKQMLLLQSKQMLLQSKTDVAAVKTDVAGVKNSAAALLLLLLLQTSSSGGEAAAPLH